MQHSLRSVSDIMRHGVISVSGSTTLDAVARVMAEHSVHAVLVVADDGDLLGWVTPRGLLREPAERWHHVAAAHAIEQPCVPIVPSANIAAAVDALLEGEVSHLAVMRPGARTPDGVVSEIDLVAAQAR